MPRKRNPKATVERWPHAVRTRAVQMYRDHTAAEVAEALGVPEGNIRRWAKDARDRDGGKPLPRDVTPAERADWSAKKEAAAQESFTIAQEALAEVRELLKAGKHLDAQRTALTFAITTDKSGVLEAAAAQAEERQATLARGQGELIAQVITRTLADLGLPIDAVKAVLAHYLKQASKGSNPDGPAPGAVAARESIRAQLRAEWEREMPRARSEATSGRFIEGPVPRLDATT